MRELDANAISGEKSGFTVGACVEVTLEGGSSRITRVVVRQCPDRPRNNRPSNSMIGG